MATAPMMTTTTSQAENPIIYNVEMIKTTLALVCPKSFNSLFVVMFICDPFDLPSIHFGMLGVMMMCVCDIE